MQKEIKIAIITAVITSVIGIAGTVITSYIEGKKENQTGIQISNIAGDNNQVIVNNGNIDDGKQNSNDDSQEAEVYLVTQSIVEITDLTTNNAEVIDSSGVLRKNAIRFGTWNHNSITYDLDKKYDTLKCIISLYKNDIVGSTTLTIKADNEIVYTSKLGQNTEPIEDVIIPLDNCKYLNISSDTEDLYFSVIISNAVVYNE